MKIKHLMGIVLIVVAGCNQPVSPPAEKSLSRSLLQGEWETELGPGDGWSQGSWGWTYSLQDNTSGSATMELHPLVNDLKGWNISWEFSPALPDSITSRLIVLKPDRQNLWHTQNWIGNETRVPIPLPRVRTDSSMYADLLELLQELTTPFFDQIITHWPDYPIPIRLVPANNGPVDLAECLTEAARIWNAEAERPWFVLDSSAGWGVRLVHFPDRELHPPLAAQITRLDSEGRPLRVHILAGNNYNNMLARPYLVRGFVHELGHALFLWGHSQDRIHCLWGLAPPLVSAPSQDERKAAQWMHGLPDGLDLAQYEISSPLRRKASWPQDDRPSKPQLPSHHCFAKCPATEEWSPDQP